MLWYVNAQNENGQFGVCPPPRRFAPTAREPPSRALAVEFPPRDAPGRVAAAVNDAADAPPAARARPHRALRPPHRGPPTQLPLAPRTRP